MLKNYLIIAWRNIQKSQAFSLLNIFGLAVGMAACILLLLHVRYENSYESFYEHADRIYRITIDGYKGSELVMQDAESYPTLGPLLKSERPEVLDYVRMHDEENIILKTENLRSRESRLYFADSSVFRIFPMKFIDGNATATLQQPWEMIITESKAIKYFGTTKAVGKTMDLIHDGARAVKVVGVVPDVPLNTHIKYDFLVSYSSLDDLGYEQSWSGNNEFTYLLMAPGTDLDRFNQMLVTHPVIEQQLNEERVVAQKVSDIHLLSQKTFEPEVNGDAKTVQFLMIIAFFTIIIAWVNYINLSTARSMERSREVGVRKVMGSSKVQLRGQFLLESLIINAISAALALFLVYMAMPVYREVSGQPLAFDVESNGYFWGLTIGLFLLGTVASGVYPAIVLSSFKPATILKGKIKYSSHGYWMRKCLVVFQFVITSILIAGTFGVYQQLNFMRDQDLGMDLEQVLVVEGPMIVENVSNYSSKIQAIKQEWSNLSNVSSVSGSGSLPGLGYKFMGSSSSVRRVGQDTETGGYTYYWVGIDHEFIETFDLEIIAGRNFSDGGNEQEVILNEEAVRQLGFNSPDAALSQKISFGDEATVIGVVKNYNHHSLKSKYDPMVFVYDPGSIFLSLKLATTDIRSSVEKVKTIYHNVFPDDNFTYFFMDEVYNQQYQADVRFGRVFFIFSLLAIGIACIGLFGLTSYAASQKKKEIGVRKVIGASVAQIVVLLSQDYIRLVLVSLVIGVPLAAFLLISWLDNFAFKMQLTWWIFAVPAVLVLIIALFAVSFQTIIAAIANPVEALRNE